MGDDQVVAVLGVSTDGCSGIGHDERAVGDVDDIHAVEYVHGVDDALGERQVVTGTRGHDRDPEEAVVDSLLIGPAGSCQHGQNGQNGR